jgi:hypothetical protein
LEVSRPRKASRAGFGEPSVSCVRCVAGSVCPWNATFLQGHQAAFGLRRRSRPNGLHSSVSLSVSGPLHGASDILFVLSYLGVCFRPWPHGVRERVQEFADRPRGLKLFVEIMISCVSLIHDLTKAVYVEFLQVQIHESTERFRQAPFDLPDGIPVLDDLVEVIFSKVVSPVLPKT